MKMILLFILLLLSCWAQAWESLHCEKGMMLVWTGRTGKTCVPRFSMPPPSLDAIDCFNPYGPLPVGTLNTFYGPVYRGGNSPWWGLQGDLQYPNMRYPGPWAYPNIQSQHFTGQGNVFAAKPNVYINSIHEEKKFEFKFTSEGKLSFLVTTPPLTNKRMWKGKILGRDKFVVEGTIYDYLFYDIRLDQEKMQFEHGVCSSRDGAIEWMMKDLKEMDYPFIAIQDFEEHWRVKIPDYPYYCIYPQYNEQLDAALPVTIDLPQMTFTRSLYILVPHKKEPDIDSPAEVPYPEKDPSTYRPQTKIVRENMFREWGVAFLGSEEK